MIGWYWLIVAAMIGASAGYFCCALMVMAREGSEAADAAVNHEELRRIIEHKDRTIVRLEAQLQKAGAWMP